MQAVPQDEIAGGNDNHISDSEENDAEAWLRSMEFNAQAPNNNIDWQVMGQRDDPGYQEYKQDIEGNARDLRHSNDDGGWDVGYGPHRGVQVRGR